ncbi:Uncharacterised protein [Mycobacterium tuberculosis]|nr:Uncharacterised protein [Mycobacterium tuberculosis]
MGTTTHVGSGRDLVHRRLKSRQACSRSIQGRSVVRKLLVGGPLGSELFVEIQLRTVQRLGGLLGLPG